MSGLLVPFLVGDAVLLWMLHAVWRRRPAWSAPTMERRVHQLMLLRLLVLVGLALVGTWAIARA